MPVPISILRELLRESMLLARFENGCPWNGRQQPPHERGVDVVRGECLRLSDVTPERGQDLQELLARHHRGQPTTELGSDPPARLLEQRTGHAQDHLLPRRRIDVLFQDQIGQVESAIQDFRDRSVADFLSGRRRAGSHTGRMRSENRKEKNARSGHRRPPFIVGSALYGERTHRDIRRPRSGIPVSGTAQRLSAEQLHAHGI